MAAERFRPQRFLAQRFRAERGSILPMTLVIVAGLSVVVLSFIGAQEGWAVRRDAQLAAEAAARAGAQVGAEQWRSSQTVSTGAAPQAMAVLASSGYQGTIRVAGREVVVTVVAPIHHTFPMPWLPTQTSATATAQLVRGTDGTQE
ncbi:MAG: hypothetical protein OES24_19190 [Acidimicrobiia bacterium]|nr:hypothetical protein [Acidimicrobiia bacterium]